MAQILSGSGTLISVYTEISVPDSFDWLWPPMVIDEVNLTIDADQADDFAAWLEPHIREILELDGFACACWFERESDGAEEPNAALWTVQYELDSREALEVYFNEHAERLRGDGLKRFAGKFEASRRILGLRKSFHRHSRGGGKLDSLEHGS